MMAQQLSPEATTTAAERPIIRRGSSSGLLTRRRSRSRGTSASSVTFDLALEIPPAPSDHPGSAGQSSSVRHHVHRIERDSQLIVRECFRRALLPRLTPEQVVQIEEVLDGGPHADAPADVRAESADVVAVITAMTADLQGTWHGVAILQQVTRVNLQSLNRSEFECHMTTLVSAHRAGHSRARISSILLFCTELALVAVRSSDRLAFCQVLNWSLDYFRKTVSAWVVRAGGWDKVTQEPPKVIASVAFVLSVLLLGRAVLLLIRGR